MSKAYLMHISGISRHIPGISQEYLSHISCISQAYLRDISGIIQVYLGISGIFEAYLLYFAQVYIRLISFIYQAYLRYISGKSEEHLRNIRKFSGKSQRNPWHILSISKVYLKPIYYQAFRDISGKSQANCRHIVGKL